MKLMVCGSALIIALLSASPVLAEDSEYLEKRMKRLHEQAVTATMMTAEPSSEAAASPRVAPGTTATPAPVETTEPWWR